MTIEQADYITKINEPSGSNYPSGYRQGDFFLPSESSQGVPVAMTHPFVLEDIPPIPDEPILTVPISATGTFYLPLGNITPVTNGIKVVYPGQSSPYLELHVPRGVSVIAGDVGVTGTVIFSGEDQYENPMVWSQPIQSVFVNVGRTPKKIFAAYINITSIGAATTIAFNLTLKFELPFTDYNLTELGSPFLLCAPSCDTDNPTSPSPSIESVGASTQYDYDFTYSAAAWEEPLTIDPAASSGSRPTVTLPIVGDNANYTLWFVNFGMLNTQYIEDFIQPIAEIYQGTEDEDEYYIYGIPQYVDSNFTTWQG